MIEIHLPENEIVPNGTTLRQIWCQLLTLKNKNCDPHQLSPNKRNLLFLNRVTNRRIINPWATYLQYLQSINNLLALFAICKHSITERLQCRYQAIIRTLIQ